MRTLLLASTLLASIISVNGSATEVTKSADDGLLKYSYNFVYLKCESASCNGAITRWYKIRVFHKFIADVPPHSEVRIYSNENVLVGRSSGKESPIQKVRHALMDQT
ncbi:hypothetical protein N473_24710 [Pseudoalteromonas luteoviolacea CPMOR-1]|uniref:Uncharacterized protein n=1 Tax=Pseudoalteromonas luteoviolacea CPMOR-1 TaxID=1365248 RepID=A0A161YH93_9GAMM|nr:hypothetical protein [Pseudoalteromonas luteoviolacea]KZN60184.1 hypothetical protein N473_24710 [Pseudoalteromonas luteoviolacea CPMOR-1]